MMVIEMLTEDFVQCIIFQYSNTDSFIIQLYEYLIDNVLENNNDNDEHQKTLRILVKDQVLR